MKKITFVALALIAGCVIAQAGMDDRPYSLTVIATATNSKTYVLRGELEAVHVAIPAGATGSVNVASAQTTLFNKTGIDASAIYYPRATLHTTAGVAATFVGGTNNAANAHYGKQAMAGEVTVRVIGESAGTNTFVTTLIYKQ
jgi:hypothetical protein